MTYVNGYYFEDCPEEPDLCELCGAKCKKYYRTDGSDVVLCVKCYEANPEPCYWCGNSTAMGSGRFVHRIPAESGWGCAECSGFMCMTCDQQIEVDCDVWDAEGLHHHPECLPIEKHANPMEENDVCGCNLCEASDSRSMG
jgi:hypothetical protein